MELINSIPASQAVGGLGYNIASLQQTNAAGFQEAYSGGARWVRLQCSWANIEIQNASPANTSGGYAMTPACVAALQAVQAINQAHPTDPMSVSLTSGYGPPHHTLLELTLPNPVAVQSTSATFTYASGPGSFSNLSPGSGVDHLCTEKINTNGTPAGYCQSPISTNYTAPGTLITAESVSGSSLTATFASATNVPLPASAFTPTGCTTGTGRARSKVLDGTRASFVPIPAGATTCTIPGGGQGGATLTDSIGTYNSPTEVVLNGSLATPITTPEPITCTTYYAVEQSLYPAVSTMSASDPAVVGFGNYVLFELGYIHSLGIKGHAELWNEPGAQGGTRDEWDNYCYVFDPTSNLYNSSGQPINSYGAVLQNLTLCPKFQQATTGQMYIGAPMYGLVKYLEGQTFPAGTSIVWAGTNFTSNPSVLGTNYSSAVGSAFPSPAPVPVDDSYHPYGGNYGNPENTMGLMSCIARDAAAGIYPGVSGPNSCSLPGEEVGANLFGDVALVLAHPTANVGVEVTETNVNPIGSGGLTALARFNVRQFLGFQAMHVTPVEFFVLWNNTTSLSDPNWTSTTNSNFDFVVSADGGQTYTPTPAFTALQSIHADLAQIAGAPVGPVTPPSVTSYSGTYPLTAVQMYGARAGDTANSYALFVYQRSFCTTSSYCWSTQASPAPGTAVISLPPSTQVVSAKDTVTQLPVVFLPVGQGAVQLPVSDNPVELLVSPVVVSTAPCLLGFCGHGYSGRHP